MRDVMSDRLSVVVPTRNRPDHAAECAKAILASGGVLEYLEQRLALSRRARSVHASPGAGGGRDHLDRSGGDRGTLWWVENRWVRGGMGRLVGRQRWRSTLEALRIGRELVVVARAA
jgi:hypothetical protein